MHLRDPADAPADVGVTKIGHDHEVRATAEARSAPGTTVGNEVIDVVTPTTFTFEAAITF
jgi:hypothetical protein